jgi:hypothetical protein
MPQAIALPIRQVIVQRHQQGQSLGQIALDLGLPYGTVRKLWRRSRDAGEAGLSPAYRRCGRRGPRGDARMIRAACWLKRLHPTWGAVLIGLILQRRWPDRLAPPERTLQRWFRRAGVNRPPGRPHPRGPRRGGRPHDVWEMDAVVKQRLADGRLASWLTITDEASGAILTAELSPPGAMATGLPPLRPGGLAPHLRTVGPAPVPAGR